MSQGAAPVTFTVTVGAPASGGAVPSGTVTATLPGPIELGSAILDSTGKAVIAIPQRTGILDPAPSAPYGLPAGSDEITFSYSGDSHYPAAQTNFTQWITPANTSTTAAIGSSAQPTQLTAAVSIDETSVTTVAFSLPGNLSGSFPTGSVQFFNGNTPIGSAPIASSGLFTSTATLSVAAVPRI